MDQTDIARVCHEANRAICDTFGDHSQKSWAEAEQGQRDSAIRGVAFAVDTPDATPEEQHSAWVRDKLGAGWTHGLEKNAEAKTHPCLVPYDELPPEQRVKDAVFRAVVLALRDHL